MSNLQKTVDEIVDESIWKVHNIHFEEALRRGKLVDIDKFVYSELSDCLYPTCDCKILNCSRKIKLNLKYEYRKVLCD